MKNPKVIRATIAGLRWAAEALEQGEIECLHVSHEDMYRENTLIGMEDTGIRTFTIKYKYIVDEQEALKELF